MSLDVWSSALRKTPFFYFLDICLKMAREGIDHWNLIFSFDFIINIRKHKVNFEKYIKLIMKIPITKKNIYFTYLTQPKNIQKPHNGFKEKSIGVAILGVT